ncbi:MAG: cytidylate kinase-like family protein [Desulfatiglans sp.]|jgi:cytidylate kinase|nr:cytidylate kinase-like family protein [Thermodesulfobacteriota bacterium]MEE4352497.1 cytidylate kinase-like family protein [Desulfatiglans sp.]
MAVDLKGKRYVPGTYAKSRPSAAELADNLIREWDKRRLEMKKAEPGPRPTICFSRKIGVGALEIADILAEKIGYHVVDRQIVEHMASETKLREETVSVFDERYPGEIREFLAMAFGERSFIRSDYSKHLFSVAYSIANLNPTIFVGRGIHLLLPREHVLAVRFICSREYRVRRLAAIMGIDEKEAGSELDHIDREQRSFFKKTYGKKDASPYEFDMVINCDYITKPEWAAEIVAKTLEKKFDIEFG